MASINKTIKEGFNGVEVKDIHNISDSQLRATYNKMLEPLVDDDLLRKTLTQETNLEKIKERIDITGTIYADDVVPIITFFEKGKNPQEVINDLTKENKGLELDSSTKWRITQELKDKGYRANYIENNEGKLSRIDIIISFRKGKRG